MTIAVSYLAEVALLGAIVDALPEAVAVALDDGVVLDANEAFCRLVGFSRESLIGRLLPLRDGIPDPSPDDARDILAPERCLTPVVPACGDGSHADVLAFRATA
jgi:PAS domain-containing protein